MVAPIQLNLPPSLSPLLDEGVRRGGFASPEAYIEHLLRSEQVRRRLEQLAIEGIESGEARPIAPDWKERAREIALREMGTRDRV